MIRFGDLVQSLWPNGAGRKADIRTGDGWVIAFAWLERDAPFSDYTGFDRTITLVEGAGFRLRFTPETSPDLLIDHAHVPTDFDGGWPTQCETLGPCLVLNAYSDRTHYRHRVEIIDAPADIDPAGTLATVAVVLRGRLPDGAGPNDSLDISTPTRLALPPGGRVAVIRIFAQD
jgi:environmental stress-induced protein Ves